MSNASRGRRTWKDRSIAGVAGSNLADGIDVCLLCVLRPVQVAATATNRSLV